MRFILPLPPNRANARWHWRTEKAKQKEYFFQCRLKHPFPPNMLDTHQFERATISVSFYLHNLNDVDNLMARCKWPVDWLVHQGWLVDDGPKVLEWVGLPTQEIDRKDQRVEITLTEIPEPDLAA